MNKFTFVVTLFHVSGVNGNSVLQDFVFAKPNWIHRVVWRMNDPPDCVRSR